MLISSTGVILEPSDTAIVEAQQILIDTYGADVNLDPASPNGLLVQNQAKAITQRQAEQANVVNSINPLIATNLQLDALCANFGITREGATSSTATVVFTGLTGTTVTQNSQVSNDAGDIFLVDTDYTIVVSGTISGTVTAQLSGETSVASNTITNIVTGIPGWSTVNNPTSGNVGTLEESDADLLKRFFETQAFNSTGSKIAIQAGAWQLTPKPTSVYTLERKENTDLVIDGVNIKAHSIYLCLQGGGSDTTIAEMFYERLSGGGNMSGTHSATITIPDSTETFTANWQIASAKVLGLNIQLKVGYVYPANIESVIAGIINNNFDFNVIGKYIEASQFLFLLIKNGIYPLLSLTFNVGSSTNLIQYTMPITDSLGTSMSGSNVSITYV